MRNKNKHIFLIFILTIIALVILSGSVNATENVYIIYGELKNETIELKPFFYLGSNYTEDNSSIESNYSAFYNIMGAEGTAAWIHQQAYKKLLEELTE